MKNIFVLLSIFIVFVNTTVQSSQDRPNVLFISIDDLNDWIGCLDGHPQAITPNMDSLAQRGVLFTNAHCAAPVCNPSRNSVMTSMYPHSSGFYANGENMKTRPELMTIPRHFKANGYQTFGAGKLFHGKSQTDLKDWTEFGPDQSIGGAKGGPFTKEEMTSAYQQPYSSVERLGTKLPLNGMPIDRITQVNKSFDWGPVNVNDEEMSDGILAQWGIDRINSNHGKPFFLGLGFYRPHIPLYAPAKYFEGLEPENIELPPYLQSDLADLSLSAKEISLQAVTAGRQNTVTAHDQWRSAIAGYLASVRFVDAQIGKVLKALDQSPYANNTVIVLWSDHGWHLGEKDHWGKFTGWERSTRVPMMVIPPRNQSLQGFKSGTRSNRTVSLVDLFPTLCELTGLDIPDQLEGKSLVPLVKRPISKWSRPALTAFGRGNFALRTEEWRYIRYFDNAKELYDVQQDPHEFTNLAYDPHYASTVEQLDAQLPTDSRIRLTARNDKWKVVLGYDEKYNRLYDHSRAPFSNDQKDASKTHPEIIKRVASLAHKKNVSGALTIEPYSNTTFLEWETLFDGKSKDLEQWTTIGRRGRTANAKPKPITGGWTIEGDTLVHTPSGGYLWSNNIYDNFILEMEVKLSPEANSGVYFWGQIDDTTNRGIEIQLLDSHAETTPTKHSLGALYDAQAPLKYIVHAAGEWQQLRIKVQQPWISVTLNQTQVLRVNINDWDIAGKNPDGTENKFKVALKDKPRNGHIALQDHGDTVHFRNIRVMRLPHVN